MGFVFLAIVIGLIFFVPTSGTLMRWLFIHRKRDESLRSSFKNTSVREDLLNNGLGLGIFVVLCTILYLLSYISSTLAVKLIILVFVTTLFSPTGSLIKWIALRRKKTFSAVYYDGYSFQSFYLGALFYGLLYTALDLFGVIPESYSLF